MKFLLEADPDAWDRYAEHCRSFWDRVPTDLTKIHGGMLTDDFCVDGPALNLHDSTVQDINTNSLPQQLVISLHADTGYGDLREISLTYDEVGFVQPAVEFLDRFKSACLQYHEIDFVDGDCFEHRLFLLRPSSAVCSGEIELIIRFKEFSLKWRDHVTDCGRATQLFEQGRELMRKGEFKNAIPIFEEANQLEPNPSAHESLAKCFEQLDRTDEAIAHLEMAVNSGLSPQPPFLLAEAYLKTGYLDRAVAAARLALERMPHYRKAQSLLNEIENRLKSG